MYTARMLLSLFPQILFLAPFSALAIRLVLAIVLGLSAWSLVKRDGSLPRVWGIAQVAAAAALAAGAWTQAIALAAFLMLSAEFFLPNLRHFPRSTVALAMIMCLALLVTGAGAFAFDLPL